MPVRLFPTVARVCLFSELVTVQGRLPVKYEGLTRTIGPGQNRDPFLVNPISHGGGGDIKFSRYFADPDAFRWWQIFASLKGLAIWISSTENFTKGDTKEPILAVAGWLMTDRHNRILVDRLNPNSEHLYAEPVL